MATWMTVRFRPQKIKTDSKVKKIISPPFFSFLSFLSFPSPLSLLPRDLPPTSPFSFLFLPLRLSPLGRDPPSFLLGFSSFPFDPSIDLHLPSMEVVAYPKPRSTSASATLSAFASPRRRPLSLHHHRRTTVPPCPVQTRSSRVQTYSRRWCFGPASAPLSALSSSSELGNRPGRATSFDPTSPIFLLP
jgi:hypothetical protein